MFTDFLYCIINFYGFSSISSAEISFSLSPENVLSMDGEYDFAMCIFIIFDQPLVLQVLT